MPNAGKKFQEATKTIMRRRSRYEKQINVSRKTTNKMCSLFANNEGNRAITFLGYVGVIFGVYRIQFITWR